jgi:hypothetical protein
MKPIPFMRHIILYSASSFGAILRWHLLILFSMIGAAVSAQKSPVIQYSGETQRFVKVGSVVSFAGNFSVTDSDNGTLKGSVVRIESGYRAGDHFTYGTSTKDDIVVTDGHHGTIAFSGEAPIDRYVSRLNSIMFSSVSPGKIVISFRISDGTNQSNVVRVEVNVIKPSNYPPSFVLDKDAVRDLQIWEDEGPRSWKVIKSSSPGPAEEKEQRVSFITDTDDHSLFVRVPSIDSTGLLMMDPTKDAYGTTQVRVRAKDNGGSANSETDISAEQTFNLTLRPVNDAPSFVKGPDITVGENSGPFVQEKWAQDISPGPANEAGQAISFELSGFKNSFFLIPPAINSTGQLTFTLAPNVFGETRVKVQAIDNGGTEHHGADRSEVQTFQLVIRETNTPPFINVPNASITYFENAPPTSMFPAVSIEDDKKIQSVQVLYLDSSVNISSAKYRNALHRSKALLGNVVQLEGKGSPERFENILKSLTYETSFPGPHQHPVMVQLTDDGGNISNLATVLINIVPVNDAPVFTKGPDLKVANSTEKKFFKSWATNIAAGPQDEHDQRLTFALSEYNPKLFTSPPQIDVHGNLTFAVAPCVKDSTTIKVVLRDDGGTAHNGMDSSAIARFKIKVVPENKPPVVRMANGSFIYYEGFEPTPLLPFLHIADEGDLKHATIHYEDSLVTLNLAAKSADPRIHCTFHALERQLDLDGVAPREIYESLLHTITYTSAAKTSRFHRVGVEVTDAEGQLSNLEYITVMVVPINDAPAFTPGPDVVVVEDAGPQVISPWATQITTGIDEPDQRISFSLDHYDTALFVGKPRIDSIGNFHFIPAPHVNGSTRFCVVMRDDGGTANGGANRSRAEMVQLTIKPVNDAPQVNVPLSRTVVAGGQYTILLDGLSAGPSEEGQTIALTASSSDRSVIPDPMVTQNGDHEASLIIKTDTAHVGSATVTLTLRDNGGTEWGGKNESVYTFPIAVIAPHQTVFVPERFSPGGGRQDNFHIRGFGVASLALRIFNYDGAVVFETEDLGVATQQGWDGTSNGVALPPGSYTWLLQGKFRDGSNLLCEGRQYGQVLLIR